MSDELRKRAEKAAREWRARQRDPRDQLHAIGEAAVAIGYEMGHAAGVEDGARAFAEWLTTERLGQHAGEMTAEAMVDCFLAACRKEWPND